MREKGKKEVYMMKKMMISLLTACATLSAAPEAIVFDFGGVMTKEPNREASDLSLCKKYWHVFLTNPLKSVKFQSNNGIFSSSASKGNEEVAI